MLTVNAMTAADTVIVPIQCEFYALDGLTQLIYTIELIQKSLNPKLTIEGVVLQCMMRERIFRCRLLRMLNLI